MTTSVQIDNVLVMRNESETIVNKEVDEYDYKENEWVFKRTVPSGLLFETITMQKEDFQLVVDYVAANFDEGYLDTQKVGQENIIMAQVLLMATGMQKDIRVKSIMM